MTERPVHPHTDVTTWSDAGSRDALALVASSVAEMVGFEIALISAVVGDHMIAVAVEGNHDIRAAMLGVSTPLEVVLPELDRADDWGRFRFVPHERIEAGEPDPRGWVPDLVPVDDPDAWHPLDLLIAPLHDADRQIVGLLSIDVPSDGLRPGPAKRHLLQRYAAQAERAMLLAVERHDLAERTRLAEAAHQVVRRATAQHDIGRVLDDCLQPLRAGLRADHLVLRTYDVEGLPGQHTPTLDLPAESRERFRVGVRACWRAQRTALFTETPLADPLVGSVVHADMLEVLTREGLGALLVVPIGAGHECLGHIVLGREDPVAFFTPDETAAALDIARDIGQAVVNARNLVREQRLVEDLRALAAYKSQLLSTVSHELKNPLGAVLGYVELLESEPRLSTTAMRQVSALERASQRMVRVVDDLLLLAEAEDPDSAPTSYALDCRSVVQDAVELNRVEAGRRGIDIMVDLPEHEVHVCADRNDLDRVLTNLVSNAVKYSGTGEKVVVRVEEGVESVQLEVIDDGLGISEADQAQLFTEFFRSSNPQAVARPGTGLGLAICARVVQRHAGRIEVDSELGRGSTFRVVLPRPTPELLATLELDDSAAAENA